MSSYNWVTHEGKKLFKIGILADGTLHNPNGYPDDVVRAAVLAADARKHDRRSRASKKAAATNSERRTLKVRIIARRLVVGQATGPASRCYVCRRKLTDQLSKSRGVGSECWQDVLSQIEKARRMATRPSA